MRGMLPSMVDRFPAAAYAAYDWRMDAACRTVDPEIFFPPGDPPSHRANAAALAICAACPVRVSCLLYALDALPYGIAGGLTAAARRRLRRALRPTTPRRYHGDQGVVRARGIALLRTGALSYPTIADRVGVSVRTVTRWATGLRPATTPSH